MHRFLNRPLVSRITAVRTQATNRSKGLFVHVRLESFSVLGSLTKDVSENRSRVSSSLVRSLAVLQVQTKLQTPERSVQQCRVSLASSLFPYPQGWFGSFPLHHVVVAVCFPSRPLAEHGVHRGLRHTSSVATFADFGKDHCGCRSSRQGEIMIDSLSPACVAF